MGRLQEKEDWAWYQKLGLGHAEFEETVGHTCEDFSYAVACKSGIQGGGLGWEHDYGCLLHVNGITRYECG